MQIYFFFKLPLLFVILFSKKYNELKPYFLNGKYLSVDVFKLVVTKESMNLFTIQMNI